jgi:hypothetical protein
MADGKKPPKDLICDFCETELPAVDVIMSSYVKKVSICSDCIRAFSLKLTGYDWKAYPPSGKHTRH